MKRKTVNYKEAKAMLSSWDQMTATEKMELERGNNMSAEEIRAVLENQCCNIEQLSITNLRDFRRDMEKMTKEMIAAVERVNGCSFDEVKQAAEKMIEDYAVESKRQRELKAALKRRMEEVRQELIEEGVIEVRNGYEHVDIVKQNRRMLEAKIEVMKEFGYHGNYYDSMFGIIKY
jgi:hypothetical protein